LLKAPVIFFVAGVEGLIVIDQELFLFFPRKFIMRLIKILSKIYLEGNA